MQLTLNGIFSDLRMVKVQPIVTKNFDKIKVEFEIEMIKCILIILKGKLIGSIFFS